MGCPDTSAHLPVQAGAKALPKTGYPTRLSAKSWLASGNASSVRVKLADVDIYATHDGVTTRLRSRRDLAQLAGSASAFVQVVPRGVTPPPAPVLAPFGEPVTFSPEVAAVTGVEAIEYFDTGEGSVPYLRLAQPSDARPVPVCLISDTTLARRGVSHHQPRPVIARAASHEIAATVWNDVARQLDTKERAAAVSERFQRLQHALNSVSRSRDAAMYLASGVFTAGLANFTVTGIQNVATVTEASYGVEDVVSGEPLEAYDNASKLTADAAIEAAIQATGIPGTALAVGWSVFHATRGMMNAFASDPPPVTTGETLNPFLQSALRRASLAALDANPIENAIDQVQGWAAVDTRGLAVLGETPAHLWLNPPMLDEDTLAAEAESLIERHVDSSRGLSEHDATLLRKRLFNEWQDGTASDRTKLCTPGHVLNMVAQERAYQLWDAEAFHNKKHRTGPPARRSRRGGRTYQSFPELS